MPTPDYRPSAQQVLAAARLVVASRDCAMATVHGATTVDMVRAALVRHLFPDRRSRRNVDAGMVSLHMVAQCKPHATSGYYVVPR